MNREDFFKAYEGKVVDALLAIDLGNSRTAMIVVDYLGEESSTLKFSKPTLLWNQESLENNELKQMCAPFGSLVSFIKPPPDTRSFIRCGKQAEHNLRATIKAQSGFCSLSSPKRYFFDQAKTRLKWIAADHMSSPPPNAPLSEMSNGFAVALAHRYGCESPDELPRAAMLGAMVAEIFEQALNYINSDSYRLNNKDNRPRWISCVHLTYPTTFSQEEKMRYVQEVDKALRVLVSQMTQGKHLLGFAEITKDLPLITKDLPFVEVLSEIDEASAVLSYYSAERINDMKNAMRWLASVGRKPKQGQTTSVSARLATIDIGGGTTDLAIADVWPNDADPDNSVNLQLLFLDGVNRAGDDFLAEFIQRDFLEPFIIACYYGTSWVPDEDSYALFAKEHNRYVANNLNIVSVLVDCVIQCIKCLERGEKAKVQINKETHGVLSDWLKSYKPDFEFPEDKVEVEINNLKYDAYLKRLETIFSPILRKMGQEIASYDCDKVIISGKLTEFGAVRELFYDSLPLPRHSIVCLSDKMQDEDVKFSTVIGGAYAAMNKLQIRNAPRTVEFYPTPEDYVWGKSTDPAISAQYLSVASGTALASHGDIISVPFTGRDVYLLRQRAGHVGTVCVSHKLSCRDKFLKVEPGASIKISVKEGERKEIIDVSGQAVGGKPLRPDQFDLRVYGSVVKRHWLDVGTINP